MMTMAEHRKHQARRHIAAQIGAGLERDPEATFEGLMITLREQLPLAEEMRHLIAMSHPARPCPPDDPAAQHPSDAAFCERSEFCGWCGDATAELTAGPDDGTAECADLEACLRRHEAKSPPPPPLTGLLAELSARADVIELTHDAAADALTLAVAELPDPNAVPSPTPRYAPTVGLWRHHLGRRSGMLGDQRQHTLGMNRSHTHGAWVAKLASASGAPYAAQPGEPAPAPGPATRGMRRQRSGARRYV